MSRRPRSDHGRRRRAVGGQAHLQNIVESYTASTRNGEMMEEHDQMLVCPACGARNVATITDFGAGAANRNEESGDCVNCGKTLIKKRCFAVEMRLADAGRSSSLQAGSH